jgi:nitronate monooxygenase
MSLLRTPLTGLLGIDLPIVGGAMYPCSNPELVGAVSAAGGVGVLQPVSLTWVHGWDFREGVRRILELSGGRPVGMNALIEGSSRRYRARMEDWIDVALEEGIRFFVTSLGNPRWVVDRVAREGGIVFHDVTERKWAMKGVDAGVQGLIAVNRRAGGHPGPMDPERLLGEIADLGLPVVCAGGVATPGDFVEALRMGYAGVQMGTRLIATPECSAPADYKEAIVRAGASDVVWSERITGVPVAVLDTPRVRAMGLEAGLFTRWMLRGRRRKHWMRTYFTLRAALLLRRSMRGAEDGIWQAGRSVAGIDEVLPVARILESFAGAARAC